MLGFNGKAAIHPSQLEVITDSFLPNEEEISEAKEIIKAFNQSSSAVIAFNGRMIDQPIILSLEKRLRLVGIDPKNID
jgi:citrate lyase beta subunit